MLILHPRDLKLLSILFTSSISFSTLGLPRNFSAFSLNLIHWIWENRILNDRQKFIFNFFLTQLRQLDPFLSRACLICSGRRWFFCPPTKGTVTTFFFPTSIFILLKRSFLTQWCVLSVSAVPEAQKSRIFEAATLLNGVF